MNVKVCMQPCNNKRKYFNCDGDIPVQRRFTTLGSHLQFQWQPHNVISWNLHNPSPCPLLLDLLISLICCSKPHAPLPFYKNLHFYEANKWHCLHKDITRWLINMWVDTFQKQLSIGGVCVRRYGPARCLLSEYGETVQTLSPECERKENRLSRALISNQCVCLNPAFVHHCRWQ